MRLPVSGSRLPPFKDLAAALQSIAVTLGLVIGGIWTWHTFGSLTQSRSIVDITVTAAPLILEEGRFLLVTAAVVNRGKSPERVTMAEAPLVVARVAAVADGSGPLRLMFRSEGTGRIQAAEPKRGVVHLNSLLLLPSVEKTFGLLVPVRDDGVYLATISIPRTDDETTVWTGSTFAVVESDATSLETTLKPRNRVAR